MSRALFLGVLALATSGCASSELRGVRNDLARTTPGLEIGEGRSFSFGVFSLGAARLAISLAGTDDVEMARAALRGARRVQFATYEVTGSVDAARIETPRRIRDYLDDGWIPVLSVRDDDQRLWLVANDHDGRPSDEFFLVSLSSDELTLVKLRGDLREVVRLALAELEEDPATDPGPEAESVAGEERSAP